ncbi:ABC transporter substrate-binding protein [Bosea sp. 2KB_26]|uniref:ABC transporter substrate-binding protein n=1 Tax=Bosea sp. 2KB_26 TaxID=3237475 RepID=UPI003F927059
MTTISRRAMLQGTLGAAIAGPGLIGAGTAQAQIKQITVADPGGAYGEAFRKAFYDPFEKATGIRVINVAREAEPTAQIKAIVETKSYTWDASILTMAARDILQAQNLLDPLEVTAADTAGMLPEAVTPYWLGTDMYATLFAYRTDRFKDDAPKSWSDFWDVKRFPGRRSLSKSPIDTLEQALLADGVPLDKLYPLDLDRAFKSLDRIKSHVAVWWSGGAQSAQIIQSGEVDLVAIWNGRAQAVLDGGAPIKLVWNQAIYSVEGFAIPKGGPRVATVRQFIKFCANPERQAAYTQFLSYGPTNTDAYKFISKERAAMLPSSTENLKGMVKQDEKWWGQHRADALERFNTWLLT